MASILLVDDDDDLRELTGELLESAGHDVRVARNGLDALRALDHGLPDLVITDVEMPLLDGPALVLRMFALDLGRENIPIVIISGAEGVANIAAGVGTPYFIAKPFSMAALGALLERALHEAIPPRPPVAVLAMNP